MSTNEELAEIWKQIEPIIVELKPGELKRIGNRIVEKTEDERIIIYEIEGDST